MVGGWGQVQVCYVCVDHDCDLVWGVCSLFMSLGLLEFSIHLQSYRHTQVHFSVVNDIDFVLMDNIRVANIIYSSHAKYRNSSVKAPEGGGDQNDLSFDEMLALSIMESSVCVLVRM